MVRNIDDMQQLGKDNMDATMKSFGALSKSMQAIAVEIADYSKKVFEQGTAAAEKLIGAKSLEKAFEVQSDYAKSSYESFVARGDQARRALCRSRQGGLQAVREPVRQGRRGVTRLRRNRRRMKSPAAQAGLCLVCAAGSTACASNAVGLARIGPWPRLSA